MESYNVSMDSMGLKINAVSCTKHSAFVALDEQYVVIEGCCYWFYWGELKDHSTQDTAVVNQHIFQDTMDIIKFQCMFFITVLYISVIIV